MSTKKKERKLLCILLWITLIALILLSVGVLFGAFFAAGLDTGIDTDLLKSVGDTTTRLFYYDENHEIAELTADRISGYQNSLYCPIEEMSPYLTGAFIAIEDKRFFDHGGIDWIRTASAMGDYLSGGGAGFGGSTITQQLIKNLTGESEKSIRRKISELIRAAKLEEMLSKEEILEKYLNVVNLSENCYGVRTAANAYFSKEPDALTLGEAATIAAITNNPTRYNPIRHPEANRERRDLILAEMYKQGMIDDGLYQKTVATQTELHVNEDALSGRVNSWYADMVISDVIEALVAERGMSEAAASRLVFSGGLRIYTAQDPRLQRMVEEYYENSANFPVHQGGRQAQSAMMIVDPKNGDILAVVGAVGKKTSNRIQSYATDTRRPSGSVIKPLSVYAPALQRGIITTATVFDDIPHSFRENGAPWPKNAPNVYRGLTTVNTALIHSVNTVSVSILEKMGYRAAFQFLKQELGMRSLEEKSDMGSAALALGQQSRGVTLSELVGGYTALANDGVFEGTRSFYKVLDSEGRILLRRESAERRVLDSENAEIMTMMLRGVVQGGTARALTLKSKVNVAGKTGTSNNSCDKWFVGYTPELLAGVWYGYEYPESLSDVKGNPALAVFDDVMNAAIGIRTPRQRHFETSDALVAVRYCRDSGKLMGEACRHDPRGDRSEIGYFKKGTEPRSVCDCHIKMRYCAGGGMACGDCPEESCYTTALIRVKRQFPRQVKVLDAPYTYGGPVVEKELKLRDNRPYYAENGENGQNFGVAMDCIPYNRLCPLHGGDAFWERRGTLPEQEELEENSA